MKQYTLISSVIITVLLLADLKRPLQHAKVFDTSLLQVKSWTDACYFAITCVLPPTCLLFRGADPHTVHKWG